MLKRVIAFILLGFMLAGTVSAEPLEEVPMALDCAAAVLMEPKSGRIIFAENADQRRPVASVTKIMTILLTIEAIESGAISTEDQVTVSANAAGMGGSQVLLDAGETQTVSELLKSTIVGSANDSAVALAEYIAGSVSLFADRMNRRATELDMHETCFINCTGLPAEGQYTTARDVAIMACELSKHDLFYRYSKVWTEDFRHESGRITTLTNTNKLLKLYDGCDGIKTGSTNEAGYCMAASAVRGDMRLIAVVLGANSGKERFDIASEMMDYGFANYRLYPVAEKGARVRGELPVQGGSAESVPLILTRDLTLLLKKGTEQGVELSADLPGSVRAPVEEGEIVGCVHVRLDGQEMAEIDIATAEAVGVRSLWDGWEYVIGKWCFQN